MIDPAQTISRLTTELTEYESQDAHQEQLVTNESALREVREFASWVTKSAMKRAAEQGADPGTAMVVAVEASTIAVLLLGVEYGRVLERDQARSLEDMLADFGGDDAV